MDWCRQVARDSIAVVGDADKIIMGIPFYGRAWASTSTARAVHFRQASELLNDMPLVEAPTRQDSIPTYKYEVPVTVTVYYEDAESVAKRAAMYKKNGITRIGFWTLGQEDEDVWYYIKIPGR
jgi:spore germination protein YaaH